eukprot:m.198222 g.198222  ORF g.198222 m.198222 type:complete len:313 (-) comp15291_c0_seq4:1269-2207(-)
MAGQIYTSGLDVNAVHEKIAELDRSLAALKQAIPTSRRNGRVLRGGKEKLGKEITGRLLLLTVLWQVLNVGLLTLLDMTTPASVFSHGNNYFELGIVLMVACQLLHLLIMVASTVKLAKQLLHHTATSSFLFQSYLSTIVLYAGIYTLLHRYQPDSWSGAETGRALSSEDYVVKSFIIFLYYSTTTITSTGYGDVYPEAWYLYLLVSSEMLLGVLYQVCTSCEQQPPVSLTLDLNRPAFFLAVSTCSSTERLIGKRPEFFHVSGGTGPAGRCRCPVEGQLVPSRSGGLMTSTKKKRARTQLCLRVALMLNIK